MSLRALGAPTSEAEVTGITPGGVMLLVAGKEYFLSFEDYPWFREAQVDHVLAVETPRRRHLRWPQLDVDLELDCLEHPEDYPLIAKSRAQSVLPK